MPDGGVGPPAAVEIPSEEADRLVEAARMGDGDAFASLFRASLPLVFRNLYGRSGSRALAEDLSSEAFARALRSISGFNGGSRDFVAWMMRISRNLYLDHVKSGRVRWESVVEQLPVVVATSDPESDALARLESDDLRKALGRLTPEQQEVLDLRFFQGLPIGDVAKIVGRNEGAVKALQFRALRSLARVLSSEGQIER